MNWINLAAWVSCTEAEGPGRRAAIWVQGCTFLCPGCCNPEFLRLRERQLISSDELAGRIKHATDQHNLEGITLLGGEPFLQAAGLADCARHAQAAGLSVMVFTGFTLEELRESPLPGSEDLLASTDVLVDGRYLAERPEEHRRWVGSQNQRFHYLSNVYSPVIETEATPHHEVEFRVDLSGHVTANGWPTPISVS